MTINNCFEFVNAREQRRRFAAALEVGRKKLTGNEFVEWSPAVDRKIHDLDQAGDHYLNRLLPANLESVSAQAFVCIVSSAIAFTPLQSTVVFGSSMPASNLLTGPSPDAVAPPLFR